MNIIYEPTGRAKEYADLAINIYKGCTHGCKYCYCAKIPWTAEKYHKAANPKKDVIEKLRKDAGKLNSNCPEILLSFTGDVYQHEEMNLGLTRQAIEVLIEHDLPFTILTKGGTRAIRDFSLLAEYPKARFGTTLIFWDQKYADEWEPNAPTIDNRVEAISEAYSRGIPTWVSLEPVIDPYQALEVILRLYPIVGHWKIGKLNYKNLDVNWVEFRENVRSLLNSLGADYYLKKSLTEL